MSSYLATSYSERQERIVNGLAWILVPLFLLAGLLLRWNGLRFVSFDMADFLIGWFDKLARNGFTELRTPFSNYTPPYLYLLLLMTKTAGFLPKVTAIKLPSIGFDLLNTILIYKILRIKYPKSQAAMALIGASAFLVLPTVLLNSAYWGQADSIYTFFLLACVYFLMKEKPLFAIILLGISFSFKAQAAFLAPLILLLMVKKKIPWLYLFIIPVIYIVMMLPAALAGRPFAKLLTIYAAQEETYSRLTSHAPNLYMFFPTKISIPATTIIGLLVTAIVALLWVTVYAEKIKEFSPQSILLCALVCVAFMPFFLPKMHERYFYLADCLSFLVAFYFPQGWLLAIGYQLVSILTYSIFLLSSVHPLGHDFVRNLLITAVLVNTAMLSYLFSNQSEWIQGDRSKVGSI